MSHLERAIAIAVEAHKGQVDKSGAPYVLHPLRMMLSLSAENERIVAVLHDVCEDCEGWTFERLADEGFSTEIIEALRSVTKMPDGEEDYFSFVRRAKTNAIGARVKRADLVDNLDLKRIADPKSKDFERLKRYRAALKILDGDER